MAWRAVEILQEGGLMTRMSISALLVEWWGGLIFFLRRKNIREVGKMSIRLAVGLIASW